MFELCVISKEDMNSRLYSLKRYTQEDRGLEVRVWTRCTAGFGSCFFIIKWSKGGLSVLVYVG